MPYCPSCESEFQDQIQNCPDCEVKLVEGPAAGAAHDPLAPFLLRTADAAIQTQLDEVLQASGVPFRSTPQGIEVPLGLSTALLPGLQSVFELEPLDTEQGVEVLGAAAVESFDSAILEQSLEQLTEAPERSLQSLRALAEGPSERLGAQAVQRLVQLLRVLDRSLDAVLLEAIEGGRRRETFALVRELKEQPPLDLSLQIAARLPQLDLAALVPALHALGQLPDLRVAPAVLSLLEHASEEVRVEADEVLCWISGEDMGFDAAANDAERAHAIGRWQSWVQQQNL